jgi:hypothetical protein
MLYAMASPARTTFDATFKLQAVQKVRQQNLSIALVFLHRLSAALKAQDLPASRYRVHRVLAQHGPKARWKR